MPTPVTSRNAAPAPSHNAQALQEYATARAVALEHFVRTSRIEPLWKALTEAMDTLLASVTPAPFITLVAVGGYGREELFPYSDVDVLVLIKGDATPATDDATIELLQQVWDMHSAVSHATRTIHESIAVARANPAIAASLMDARFITGDQKVFRSFKRAIRKEVIGANAHNFITAKMAERDARHAKWGDSRFMLEPNVKEGKGGLRDLQTLNWIADYCHRARSYLLTPAEWKQHRDTYAFFAIVRAHMHEIRGRAEERLTFDLQKEIATRLKFRGRSGQEKAERFMRRYFQFARTTGALTRVFCAGLEGSNLRPQPSPFSRRLANRTLPDAYYVDAGRLNFTAPDKLEQNPAQAVGIFAAAAEQEIDIQPRAYMAIERTMETLRRRLLFEGEANRLFLDMLLTNKTPELHLRRMNESGVLGALIPEFERVIGMMQYDGYHTFTVDEHTLVAIGNLAMIEQGGCMEDVPLATKEARQIVDRAPLYLALLCHDLAKGTGGGHEDKGSLLAERIAQRMGLSEAAGQLTAWLVKYHALLSEVAFKRDLDDPQTMIDFVGIVQSPERLRLLLLMTVSDIRAVGPNIWNGWKGALMRDLYHRAMAAMGVEASPAPHPDALASDAYQQWLADRTKPAFTFTHDAFRDVTQLTCCAAHDPLFFRRLTGVLAYIGASIVTARIMLVEETDAALFHIGIQNVAGHSFADEEKRLANLSSLLEKAAKGELDFAAELPQRRVISKGREVAIETAVFVDNAVSASATVIEVNTRDRLGLLYDILGGLEASNLQLISAQLATYGKKAVDVFYVKDAYGHKVTHWTKLAEMQRVLLESCAEKETSA